MRHGQRKGTPAKELAKAYHEPVDMIPLHARNLNSNGNAVPTAGHATDREARPVRQRRLTVFV